MRKPMSTSQVRRQPACARECAQRAAATAMCSQADACGWLAGWPRLSDWGGDCVWRMPYAGGTLTRMDSGGIVGALYVVADNAGSQGARPGTPRCARGRTRVRGRVHASRYAESWVSALLLACALWSLGSLL